MIKGLVRSLAAILILISLTCAYAEAFPHSNLAQKLGQNNLRFLYKTGDYRKLVSVAPYYGRGWLLKGFAEAKSGNWDLAKESFEKAETLNPSSVWTKYMISSTLLRSSPQLSEAEKTKAVERLRQAVRIFPERYLKPSLGLLWKNTREFPLLVEITPHGYETYKILVDFMIRNNIWEFLAPVFNEYLRLQELAYQKALQEAFELQRRSYFEKAYDFFLKAYWISQSRMPAKEGLLATYEEAAKKLPKGSEAWLREIRESKNFDPPSEPSHLLPADAWRPRKVLKEKQKGGVVLNLKSGNHKIKVVIKNLNPLKGAFILFRLNERVLQSAFLEKGQTADFVLDVRTPGGKRWFEVEVNNPAAVELGTLEVIS